MALGCRVFIAGVLLAALVGCGGNTDGMKKQIDELHGTLAKIRADQAVLAERLEALELARTPSSSSSGAKATSDRPDLDVVRLGPEAGEDAGGDAQRTVIRATGSGGSIEKSEKSLGPGKDYDAALELWKQKKTDKAIAAFSSFLSRYPEDPHAEAIMFLRGEAYAGKGDHRRAIVEYEAVASQWPKGQRAPEAILRVSQSYSRLGDKNDSDEAKKRLLADYPTSDAAKKLDQTGKKP